MQSSVDVSSEVFEKRSHAYGILYHYVHTPGLRVHTIDSTSRRLVTTIFRHHDRIRFVSVVFLVPRAMRSSWSHGAAVSAFFLATINAAGNAGWNAFIDAADCGDCWADSPTGPACPWPPFQLPCMRALWATSSQEARCRGVNRIRGPFFNICQPSTPATFSTT